jgi:hypothetical protein
MDRAVVGFALGVAIFLALVGAAWVVRTGVGSWRKYRGVRLVNCPETMQAVAVEVNARHAARSAVDGQQQLRLQTCTRWPERQDCGQECLAQIAESPRDCLVRSILEEWYRAGPCVLCGKPIGTLDWFKHRPAFMRPDGSTITCDTVAAQDLPAVLTTHHPVCWDCHIVESVCRKHPDRITIREQRSA